MSRTRRPPKLPRPVRHIHVEMPEEPWKRLRKHCIDKDVVLTDHIRAFLAIELEKWDQEGRRAEIRGDRRAQA